MSLSDIHKGQLFAVLAFLFWGGIAPIYFKEVSSVGAFEVLIHRVVWSFVLLLPLVFITKQASQFLLTIKNFTKLKYLFFSTIFISINWVVFIWAVANDKIMEASLGYYINPLVNVFLGFLIFGERMTKNQYLAIAIAFIAIVYQVITLGTLPLVSLVLAFTFGFYGMLRKKVDVGSIVGLTIETLLLLPFGLAYLWYLVDTNTMSFLSTTTYINWMLVLGGIVTVTPLLLFNGAATRMKLTTLGFFQYIGPTIAFFVALFIYNEEFNVDKLITFIIIWIALVIFSLDAIIKRKKV